MNNETKFCESPSDTMSKKRLFVTKEYLYRRNSLFRFEGAGVLNRHCQLIQWCTAASSIDSASAHVGGETHALTRSIGRVNALRSRRMICRARRKIRPAIRGGSSPRCGMARRGAAECGEASWLHYGNQRES